MEVQTADVVVTGQRIRHEIAMHDSPRSILLPRIHDETVTKFVGQVGEGVLAAALSQIDGDVRNESVLFEELLSIASCVITSLAVNVIIYTLDDYRF